MGRCSLAGVVGVSVDGAGGGFGVIVGVTGSLGGDLSEIVSHLLI